MKPSIVLLALALALSLTGCAFASYQNGQVSVSSFGNGCAVVRHDSEVVASCARAVDIGPITNPPIQPGAAPAE